MQSRYWFHDFSRRKARNKRMVYCWVGRRNGFAFNLKEFLFCANNAMMIVVSWCLLNGFRQIVSGCLSNFHSSKSIYKFSFAIIGKWAFQKLLTSLISALIIDKSLWLLLQIKNFKFIGNFFSLKFVVSKFESSNLIKVFQLKSHNIICKHLLKS